MITISRRYLFPATWFGLLALFGSGTAFLTNSTSATPSEENSPGLRGMADGSGRLLQTRKTLDYLKSISGSKTVAGIHNRYNRDPTLSTRQATQVSGHTPGLWSGDFLYDYDNIKNRWTMINEAKKQWEAGSMISILWHACNPALNCPSTWDVGSGPRSALTDGQFQELITDGTGLNSKWKQMMDEVAEYLQYLQESGVEVMFRPLHEMNQGAFWWGGRPGPQGTRKLYQITRDYFINDKGLRNLIWVWNMQDLGSRETVEKAIQEYNPGSNYWDIATMDVYESWETWKYQAMVQVSGGKPIAIGECQVLPDANRLANEPRWTFFMSWSELTFEHNSDQEIRDLYNSPRVLTQDELWQATNDPVSLLSYHNTYLSGWNDGSLRLQPWGQEWEFWTKEPLPSGRIALRSYHGSYISAWTDGTLRLQPSAHGWEEWTEIQNGDGSQSYRSHRGTYLSAWPDGSVRQSNHNNEWEHWR